MEKRLIAQKIKLQLKEAFLSDLQIPFQDDLALEIAMEIMREFEPDLIWLGGDIIDDYTLSGFLSSFQIDFTEEIEETKKFLNRLRKTFPRAKIVWQEGNHELRIRNYILARAPRLERLLGGKLSMEEIFELPKIGVEYVRGPQKIGRLYHIHGHERRFSGQLVHVALNYLRWLQRNVIFGHWHVCQRFPLKEIDGTMKEAYANPCLFDISKMPYGGYTTIDLNHRGFSLVEYYDGGLFQVKQLLFIPQNGGYLVKTGTELKIYKWLKNEKRNK